MIRHVTVIHGVVYVYSPTLSRFIKSSFPAVDLARHDALKGYHVFPGFTDAEREIAQRFDVNKAIADVISAREAAGLPVDIDKK